MIDPEILGAALAGGLHGVRIKRGVHPAGNRSPSQSEQHHEIYRFHFALGLLPFDELSGGSDIGQN